MAKGSDARTQSWSDGDRRSALVLAEWISDNFHVLLGLYALRSLGSEAEDSVASVMQMRPLKATQLSWELWGALGHGREADVDALLLEHLSVRQLDIARGALWGIGGVDDDNANILRLPLPDIAITKPVRAVRASVRRAR